MTRRRDPEFLRKVVNGWRLDAESATSEEKFEVGVVAHEAVLHLLHEKPAVVGALGIHGSSWLQALIRDAMLHYTTQAKWRG